MSAESMVIEVLAEVAPVLVEGIVSAIAAAVDSGKSDAEAIEAARAAIPGRIDTTLEDAERRARIAKRHGISAETVVTDRDIATRLAAFGRRDTEPPMDGAMLATLRDLSIAGPLRTGELAAVRWALAQLDPPRLRNGG